jgi:predicted nucleic acid-binding protein
VRVVLDANVFLSGIPRLRDQDTSPRKLIAAWLDGAFDLVLSDHITEEVVRNLRKPYFVTALSGVDAVGIFEDI